MVAERLELHLDDVQLRVFALMNPVRVGQMRVRTQVRGPSGGELAWRRRSIYLDPVDSPWIGQVFFGHVRCRTTGLYRIELHQQLPAGKRRYMAHVDFARG